jgi:hypothetical protein
MSQDPQPSARPKAPLVPIFTVSNIILIICLFLVGDMRLLFMAVLMAQLVSPWLLVVFVGFFPNRFTFGVFRAATDPPSSLAAALFANMWANLTVFAAVSYVELTNHTRSLIYGVGLALLLIFAMIFVDRKGQRRWGWPAFIFLCLTSLIYGYTAVSLTNVALDRSPGVVAYSVVERKIHFYKGGLQVRVSPWGPVREVKDLEVPHAIYKSLMEHGPVCIATRTGALGIPWYTAQACPWRGDTVSFGGADLWWLSQKSAPSNGGQH